MDGQNKAELSELLQQEWHNITLGQGKRLKESLPRPIKAVIKCQD